MSDRFEFEAWETPEEAGVSSTKLSRFLEEADRLKDKVQFHSMVLLRHGKVVCRFNWAPYDDQTPHALYSLSKSFCSAAAGFAVQEGWLSWDTSVVDILPEEIPEGRAEELRQLTLSALLSMGSGLDPASDSIPREDEGVTWAAHVLSHHVQYPPMAHFHYNTLGTYLVACMVQKATGEDLVSYLKPRLFDPLDIPVPAWDMSPEGVCCGGFGLYLSADSIARFGQCLLSQGQWQGQQLLPEGWVRTATAAHIDNSNGQPDPDNEWAQGYGWQFWRCTEGRYRGDGRFGQVCMVDEKLDAVLAVTCATNDMGAEFRLIREQLFPAFDAAPGTVGDQERLLERAGALVYPCPGDDGSERPLPRAKFLYRMGDGQEASIGLGMEGDQLVLSFNDYQRFYFSKGGRLETLPRRREEQVRWLGASGWREDRLLIDLRSPDGPYTMSGALDWDDQALYFDGVGMEFPDGHAVFEACGSEEC